MWRVCGCCNIQRWRELDPLAHYISNQEEHHRHRTFQEELTTFLEEAGVEYDPKYLP